MDLVASALAKAVTDGDFVNFRLLFAPFSPARAESTEAFGTVKYGYLLPTEAEQQAPAFQAALRAVREPDTWRQIQGELDAARPARLPGGLIVALGDNAMRAGKFTVASQAYEVLRIRERMQRIFFELGDRALTSGNIPRAVHAYDMATGLHYNYAGFPEPLPLVNDFQTRALILHGVYPTRPDDCVAAMPPEFFMSTALAYLLNDSEAAARLEARPMEVRMQFLFELIRRRDPEWDKFADRFNDTCKLMQEFNRRMVRKGDRVNGRSLEQEIEAQQSGDPRVLSATLLGREIPEGEWWQYLKELAFQHPAAPLFIARQLVGDVEIVVPRLPAESPIPGQLGLSPRIESA